MLVQLVPGMGSRSGGQGYDDMVIPSFTSISDVELR